MDRRYSLSHAATRTSREDAREHMRQRAELSRLVHGIDKDVLELFYGLDAASFERMAGTYGHLFGPAAEQYMREARATWQAGRTGVSGKNAARLMLVVPHFITDVQREALLAKLRPLIGTEQIKAWLEGLESTVRNDIKVIAEPRRGATLPPLPARRPANTPAALPQQPRGQFVMNAVVASAPPAPARPQPPASPTPVSRPTHPANRSSSGCAVALVFIPIVVVLLIIAGNPQPPASRTTPTYTAPAQSVVPSEQTPAIQPATLRVEDLTRVDPAWQKAKTWFPDVDNPASELGQAVQREFAALSAAGSPELQAADAPSRLTERVAQAMGIAPVPFALEVKFARKQSKDRAHLQLVSIGGTNADGSLWALSPAEVMTGLQARKYLFFVTQASARSYLSVATNAAGQKTLKTEADTAHHARLLELPDFPLAHPTPAAQVPAPADESRSGQGSTVPVQAGTTSSYPASAPAAVYVQGFTRKDGTYVAPYYRTHEDGSTANNWSARGNSNPYTGARGTKSR